MIHAPVRQLSRLLLALFYRRTGIANAERIPVRGPLIVAANHHNSLVDPMFLLASIERPLRPLAKAPLFASRVVGPFLRALDALAVYRPQDRHLVRGSNRGLVEGCLEALGRGEAILIFPEGISKAEPYLSELRPGAARMALEAEARAGWTLGVKLVPVGIHFDEAGRFRRGRVFGLVGDPIAAAEHRALYERDAEAAVQALTERLAAAIRGLIAEAAGTEELRLLRIALRAWSRERGEHPNDAAEARLAAAFARGYRAALAADPAAVLRLRNSVESWARTLAHFDLSGDEIDYRYGLGPALGWALRRGSVVLLGALFGLLGLLLNWLPFRTVGIVAGRLSEGEDAWASFKIGASLVVFPVCWLGAALAAGWFLGPLAGAAGFLAAPLLGLAALGLRDRAHGLARDVRAFLLLAGGSGLARHLRAERRSLYEQVEGLRQRLDSGAGEAPATGAPPPEEDEPP